MDLNEMEKKNIVLLGTAGIIGYVLLSSGATAQGGGGGGFGGIPQLFSFGTGEVTAPLSKKQLADTQIPALPDVNIYEAPLPSYSPPADSGGGGGGGTYTPSKKQKKGRMGVIETMRKIPSPQERIAKVISKPVGWMATTPSPQERIGAYMKKTPSPQERVGSWLRGLF